MGAQKLLGRAFFRGHFLHCARELVGCELVWNGCGGIVVETEAYAVKNDEACHAFSRASTRAFVEKHPAGTAYGHFRRRSPARSLWLPKRRVFGQAQCSAPDERYPHRHYQGGSFSLALCAQGEPVSERKGLPGRGQRLGLKRQKAKPIEIGLAYANQFSPFCGENVITWSIRSKELWLELELAFRRRRPGTWLQRWR
jgi:Methylpurine-DNA glycosylase (MPG)